MAVVEKNLVLFNGRVPAVELPRYDEPLNHGQSAKIVIVRGWDNGGLFVESRLSGIPFQTASERIDFQNRVKPAMNMASQWIEKGEPGGLGIVGRSINAASAVFLPEDDRFGLVMKVYDGADGKIVKRLDLFAGTPQTVNQNDLKRVEREEVDTEEAILVAHGRLMIHPEYAKDQSLIWEMFHNYQAALHAGFPELPDFETYMQRAYQGINYRYRIAQWDNPFLPPELIRALSKRKAAVKVINARNEAHATSGFLFAHDEGFDLASVRLPPEGVRIRDLQTIDLEWINDHTYGGQEVAVALNRNTAWLSIQDFKDFREGRLLHVPMTGPHGATETVIDPAEIQFKALANGFVDALLVE